MANVHIQKTIKQVERQEPTQQVYGRCGIHLEGFGDNMHEGDGDQYCCSKAHEVNDVGTPPCLIFADDIDANRRHYTGQKTSQYDSCKCVINHRALFSLFEHHLCIALDFNVFSTSLRIIPINFELNCSFTHPS
jgi:hypothetical protein